MKCLFSFLFLCQILGISAGNQVDSILSILDKEIEQRNTYYQQKELKKDALITYYMYQRIFLFDKFNLCL